MKSKEEDAWWSHMLFSNTPIKDMYCQSRMHTIAQPCYTQIWKFPYKYPPNMCNSECNHPPATSGIAYMYLLVPPTCSIVLPYYTPLPSYPAPTAYQQPHLLTQRTLLPILTNLATMAKVLFGGGWGIPGVDWSYGSGKSWVFIYQRGIYRWSLGNHAVGEVGLISLSIYQMLSIYRIFEVIWKIEIVPFRHF